MVQSRRLKLRARSHSCQSLIDFPIFQSCPSFGPSISLLTATESSSPSGCENSCRGVTMNHLGRVLPPPVPCRGVLRNLSSIECRKLTERRCSSVFGLKVATTISRLLTSWRGLASQALSGFRRLVRNLLNSIPSPCVSVGLKRLTPRGQVRLTSMSLPDRQRERLMNG